MVEPLDELVDHVRGKAGSPVILEYGDYECPYSRQAFRAIERVEREPSGAVGLAFRHFPLTQIHPHASAPAAAAEAAARQGRFWAMHTMLVHRQKALEDDHLRAYAREVAGEVPRFDFVDHSLLVRTHDGRVRSFDLAEGVPVADFDGRLHAALSELGVDVEIKEHPFGVPMTTPFPEDREHAAWDRAAIESYGRILDWTDRVFEEFSGWFSGKTSPVHLFWHSLDLAVTRFSGRPAPPIAADAVPQEAYSQELISFGFWAGDDNVPDATYYSYTSPEPDGLRDQALPVGEWIEFRNGSLAVL